MKRLSVRVWHRHEESWWAGRRFKTPGRSSKTAGVAPSRLIAKKAQALSKPAQMAIPLALDFPGQRSLNLKCAKRLIKQQPRHEM